MNRFGSVLLSISALFFVSACDCPPDMSEMDAAYVKAVNDAETSRAEERKQIQKELDEKITNIKEWLSAQLKYINEDYKNGIYSKTLARQEVAQRKAEAQQEIHAAINEARQKFKATNQKAKDKKYGASNKKKLDKTTAINSEEDCYTPLAESFHLRQNAIKKVNDDNEGELEAFSDEKSNRDEEDNKAADQREYTEDWAVQNICYGRVDDQLSNNGNCDTGVTTGGTSSATSSFVTYGPADTKIGQCDPKDTDQCNPM